MPGFKYKAKKGTDEIVEGVLIAEDQSDAVNKLAERNLYPIEVELEGVGSSQNRNFSKKSILKEMPVSAGVLRRFLKRKISSKEMLIFTQNLATLTRAKMELLPSLRILQEQQTNFYFKEIISKICGWIKEGKSFSQSLKEFPGDFSVLFVSIIKAGETSGNMEAALTQITFFLQRKESLKNKVLGALIYPAILMGIGVISVFVILNFVIPRLQKLFTQARGEFPLITKIILKLSQFSSENWMWMILLFTGFITAVMLFKGSKVFTKFFKWMIVRVPVIKRLIKSQELASFSQALTLLLGRGVPALESLEIASLSIEDLKIKKEIEQVITRVRNGQTISSGMIGIKSLPDFFVKMIMIGEESGRLEEILAEVADSYSQQIDTDITIITSILEPVLILILGVVLGGIVLSILLPIFQLTQMIR